MIIIKNNKPTSVEPTQLLIEHNTKIEELRTRLNSLENLVNEIHQMIPAYNWDNK